MNHKRMLNWNNKIKKQREQDKNKFINKNDKWKQCY